MPDVIIDDLDLSASAHPQLTDTLGSVALLISRRGRRLLVTTQTLPMERLLAACAATAEAVSKAPKLSLEEVGELARSLGCPETEQLNGWVLVSEIRSRGHPQLARAVLLDARRNGWPAPLTPRAESEVSGVEEVRREARRLIAALPEPARELVLRLALVGGRFRRRHALALADAPPPIGQPGIAFETVIDSWLETLAGGYFRISPLLDDAALQTFSPARLRELHIAIAAAIWNTEELQAEDAALAFQHAWESRYVPALGGLARSLIEAPRDVWRAIAVHAIWFVVEELEPGKDLLPTNPTVSQMLRMFQFRLASVAAPKIALRVFRAWMDETRRDTTPGGLHGKVLAALHGVGTSEMPLTAAEVVTCLEILFQAETEQPEFREYSAEALESVPPALRGEFRFDGLASMQAAFTLHRGKDVAYLEEWLTAMEQAPSGLREKILDACRANPWWSHSLIDRAWLDEEAKPQPDWQRCFTVLHRTRVLAMAWQAPPLAVAAVRAIAVIRDEYLKESATALAELDRFIAESGLRHPRLEDERATVLFHLGDYEGSVLQWDSALENWQPASGYDRYPAFAARQRAIALGRMEKWPASAVGFANARQLLPADDATPQAAGLMADAAWSWWRAGDRERAFDALHDAAQLASMLPAGKEDLLVFRIRRMVGHTTSCFHSRLTGWTIEGQPEIPPGAASDLQTPEELRSFPERPFDYVWAVLMRVENALMLDRGVYEHHHSRLLSSSENTVRYFALQTELERAFRLGSLQKLPSLANAIDEEMRRGTARMRAAEGAPAPGPHGAWTPEHEVTGATLFRAAFVALAAQPDIQAVMSAWRDNAAALGWGSAFNAWIERASRYRSISLDSARALMSTPEHFPDEDYVLVLARIIADPRATPAVALDASLGLVRWSAQSVWRTAIASPLVGMVESTWSRLTASPAMFPPHASATRTLRQTCEAPSTGLAKAAAIVLAACAALRRPLSTGSRKALENIAADTFALFQIENPFGGASTQG